jgi:hypothetical protein
MRKVIGLSLVSLAMVLSACGDDDSDNDTTSEDQDSGGGTTSEDKDSGGGGPTETEPTETETDSGGPTAPTTSSPDAGSETGGVDAGTTVEAGDSGSTEATDAGTTPSGDAATDSGTAPESDAMTSTESGGDAGGDAGQDACLAACAAAAAKDCGDNSTCETDLCGIRDVSADCSTQADAYLACIGESDPDADFTCDGDKASYTGMGCQDPYFNDWLACVMGM